MVKHTHKAGESLIGMPGKILVRSNGEYHVAYFTGEVYDCEYDVWFCKGDSFDWYDLTELGE